MTAATWHSKSDMRCTTCGTPVALTYDSRAERFPPTHHYGREERLSWTAGLGAELPSRPTHETW